MKLVRQSARAALAMAVASVLALASCSDSNQPSDSSGFIDPQGLQTEMNGLVAMLTAGPLIGMRNTQIYGATAMDQLSRGHGSGLSAIMGVWPTVGGDRHLVTMGDAIDDSYYSTVFVVNPQTFWYEDDGTNSGPANGVRFVLYALNSGAPDHNTPLGYLDVLDQSDQTKSQVGIVVTDLNRTVTYANYSITLPDTFDPVAQAYDLVASGTLSDGQDIVDFSAHRAQTSPSDLRWNVSLTGPHASMIYDFESTTDPQTNVEQIDVDFTVQGRNETVRESETQDYDHDTATYGPTSGTAIWADGRSFASATPDHPFWVKENGQPLTSAEENLIEAIGVARGENYDAYALVYFLAIVTP